MKLGANLLLAMVLTGLSSCASESWSVPAGASAAVVSACREDAMSGSADDIDPLQQQRDEFPGAGAELMREAMAEKQATKSGLPPAQVLFYQCLESNGVALDAEQIAIVEDWRKN